MYIIICNVNFLKTQDNNDHNCPLEGDLMHSSDMPQVMLTLHHTDMMLIFYYHSFENEIQLLILIINNNTTVNYT